MNNNSYVRMPLGKFMAIITQCCPPFAPFDHCSRLAHEDCAETDCIDCWKSFFKDGE